MLAQLVLGLSAPGDGGWVGWVGLVSVSLQAMILWSALAAARLELRAPVAVAAAIITAILVLSVAIDLGETVPALVTIGLIIGTPLIVAVGVLRSIRIEGRVTLHAMYGVLGIYLMLGYAFALVFWLIGQLSDDPFFADGTAETASNLLYFAFTTLTTVGFGDLTPAEGAGRSFAIALALAGQIYLVTVVAMIVSSLGRSPVDPQSPRRRDAAKRR